MARFVPSSLILSALMLPSAFAGEDGNAGSGQTLGAASPTTAYAKFENDPGCNNPYITCVPCEESGKGGSAVGSIVKNFTLSYVHWASDWRVSRGGASGCSPCGGGLALSGDPNRLPTLDWKRTHVPRDIAEWSSLGKGVFSPFDVPLTVSVSNNQATSIKVYLPDDQVRVSFTPVLDGANVAIPGLYRDTAIQRFKELRLYTSFDPVSKTGTQLTAAQTWNDVRAVVIHHHDGQFWHYERLDVDTREQWNIQIAADAPIAALPAGGVEAVGLFMQDVRSYNPLWFDDVEVLKTGVATPVYREVFPFPAGWPTDLKLQASYNPGARVGWTAQAFQTTALANTARLSTANGGATWVDADRIGSNPQDPGSTGSLQWAYKERNVLLSTTETAAISGLNLQTSQLQGMRFKSYADPPQTSGVSQTPEMRDVRMAVKVGGTWYITTTGNRHGPTGWEQMQLLTSGAQWQRLTIGTTVLDNFQVRLKGMYDRNSRGIVLGYPAQPIDTSGEQHWRLWNSVTDAQGRVASVTWQPAQISSKWVIDFIDFPSSTGTGTVRTQYRYDTSANLTSVEHADGTATSLTWGSSGVYSKLTIADPMAEEHHRNKTVWLINENGSTPDGGNSAANRVRKVQNGAGEWVYLSIYIQDIQAVSGQNTSRLYIYEGGNQWRDIDPTGFTFAKQVTYTDSTTTPGTFSAWSQLNFVGDGDRYAWNTYASLRALAHVAPNTIVDETGAQHQYLYDPTTFAITQRTRTSDSAVWSWTRTEFNQVLVETDALTRQTKYTYSTDGRSNLLKREVGILNGVNQTAPEYAFWQWSYIASTDPKRHLMATATDARGNVTNYEYDAQLRLTKVLQPADDASSQRGETRFVYDNAGRVAQVRQRNLQGTTELWIVTRYSYDAVGRLARIDYRDTGDDTDYEQFTYFGASDGLKAGHLKIQRDRNGNTVTYDYDNHGRRISASYADTVPTVLKTESWTYLVGSNLVKTHTVDGDTTTYAYDYRNRVVGVSRSPRSGVTLTESTTYVKHRPAVQTDAYGRRSFTVYQAHTNFPIRTVQELIVGGTSVPTAPTLSDIDALKALARVTSGNPAYVITDRVYDKAGQVLKEVDGRGFVTTHTYDSRGQRKQTIAALEQVVAAATADQIQGGTAALETQPTPTLLVAATTQWFYDAQGNVSEERLPRYFDTAANDATGSAKARRTYAYTNRNLLKTRTEATGATEAGATNYAYTLTGKVAKVTNALTFFVSNAYGSCCDRLISTTDEDGFITSFTYDKVGNRLTVTDPENKVTTYTYDGLNRVKTVKNGENETVTYAYITNATDTTAIPAAQTTGLGLGAGANGSAVRVTNHLAEATLQIQDGMGRPVRIIDGNGNATTTTYDTVVAGLLETTVTDALAHASKARSDAAGRTREMIDALGKVSTASYDAQGNRVRVRDALGVGMDCTFDGLGRDLACTDTAATPVTTKRTYDKHGNVRTMTDGLTKVTTCTYDARDRKTTCVDRVAGTTTYAYDKVSNLTSITDAENRQTIYRYNKRNLLIEEEYPPGQQTPFKKGQTGAVLPVAGTPGNVDIRIYTYFTNGQLQTRLDQEGVLTTYGYDLANRLTSRSYPDALNDSFVYDDAGRLTSAVSGRYAITVSRSYTLNGEKAGRLREETQVLDGRTFKVQYLYDAANRMTKVKYPTTSAGGVEADADALTLTYTDRDQQATLAYRAASVASWTYDDAGRPTTIDLGNGLRETRTYKAGEHLLDELKTFNPSTPATIIVGFGYAYDANKRKTQEVDLALAPQSQYFAAYDHENRVTRWERGADSTARGKDYQTWTLSKVGDWSATTRYIDRDANATPDTLTQTRTHSTAHELTSIDWSGTTPPALPTPDPASLTYDRKGNLTVDASVLGGQRSYRWDVENRLDQAKQIIASVDTVVGTYRYDALGRRIVKDSSEGGVATTRYFVHAGAQVIQEWTKTGSNAPAAKLGYVWGPYIDELRQLITYGPVSSGKPSIAARHTPHANHLYSIAALTKADKGVLERYRYDSYGAREILTDAGAVAASQVSQAGNQYGYTGRYHDSETGLTFFRARHYSPVLGRFVTRDPLVYPDGFNFYAAYFLPNAVDPEGTSWYVLDPGNSETYRRNSEILQDQQRRGQLSYEEYIEKSFLNKKLHGPTVLLTRERRVLVDRIFVPCNGERKFTKTIAIEATVSTESTFGFKLGGEIQSKMSAWIASATVKVSAEVSYEVKSGNSTTVKEERTSEETYKAPEDCKMCHYVYRVWKDAEIVKHLTLATWKFPTNVYDFRSFKVGCYEDCPMDPPATPPPSPGASAR